MHLSEILEFSRDLNILFIDDDESFRKETVEILEILFKKVDIAINGKDGLEKYNSFHEKNHYYYDLVVSDIIMPFMDGEEFITQIKKTNQDQFIVVISASTESSSLINFIKLGVEDFLVKPISQDSLKESIYKVSKKICDNKVEMKSSAGKTEYAHNLLVPDEYELNIY